MHPLGQITAFIKNESLLMDHEIDYHFAQLHARFKEFLSKLEQQDEQTKIAFQMLVQSAIHGRQLTHDEKIEIETQLKELLKTVNLVALTILPGGSIVLIISSFLKLNTYIIPAVFLSKP